MQGARSCLSPLNSCRAHPFFVLGHNHNRVTNKYAYINYYITCTHTQAPTHTHTHTHTPAEFSVKHMNSSSCSAAKVISHFITLALSLCFSVVSPSFYFLGNIPHLLHLTMQTEKNLSHMLSHTYTFLNTYKVLHIYNFLHMHILSLSHTHTHTYTNKHPHIHMHTHTLYSHCWRPRLAPMARANGGAQVAVMSAWLQKD